MKVTLDASRILHLVILICLSFTGAWFLVTYFEWTPMTAFGFACTLVTQLSNLLLQLWSAVPPHMGGKRINTSNNPLRVEEEETARAKKHHKLRKR